MTVLPVLLVVGVVAALWRRPGRLGRFVRFSCAAAFWFVVAVALVAVLAIGVEGLSSAGMAARVGLVAFGAAVFAGWRFRAGIARRHPELVARIDRRAFVVVFTAYATVAAVWLLLGLVPALAAGFPAVDRQLREWGNGDNVMADMALQAARAARNSSSVTQVTLDYLFSTVNLALAAFLVVKVRGNRTANLLALGMVGTAIAFNLQSHAALQVVGPHLGSITKEWHDYGVHVLAGVCYVFALLLFPDGAIDKRRGLQLMGIAVVVGLASFVAIEDHTSALVLLFGVMVPAAALTAQSRRYRIAASPELRKLFQLLRVAMGLSLAGAIAVLAVTSSMTDDQNRAITRDYELQAPREGQYVFYCDPHIDDMHGVVVVGPPRADRSPPVVPVVAHHTKFDTNIIHLSAGQPNVIRFTNEDGVAHNVSIYRDSSRRDSVYIGQLFTGLRLATFTFRVFRFVFIAIPIALFIAILRFHLWDVQRLASRAMVYAALTGILGLAYGIGALVVAYLPGRVFHQGQLLVIWVLAAALLIRPARRRVQAAIDKRFYREKLDAVRTLEAFAAHVRDEIDLDRLAEQLVGVVADTMHPEYVSLWVRDPEDLGVRDQGQAAR